MRALGGDVTGRHACGNAAGGKGNNESHQESGLIFKVMDKNDPKVATVYITRESSVQVPAHPTNYTLKNKHSYDTLNSKRSRGTENFVI
jgi:hypothetical protein